MNKRRSSHAHLGKYIFALPVVMVLALVFTLTKAYEAEPDQLPEEMWVSGDVISSGALTDKSLPQNTVIIGRRMQAVLNHQDSALKNSDRIKISGDSLIIRGEKKFVLGTVKGNPMFVLDGVPVANGKLSEIHSDDIESVAVLKGASAVSSYGSTAREGVILIKTKQGVKVNNVTSATAVRSGSEVAGRIIQADSVQVTRIKIEGSNLDEDPRLREMVVKGFPAAVQDSVIVRGVRRIEGSRLFKTGDSVSFNFRQGSRMTVSILDSMNFQSAPPYVLIDGKEGDLSAVSPEKIESITVLKGDNDSAKRYGSRAAHGVVLVMTKK